MIETKKHLAKIIDQLTYIISLVHPYISFLLEALSANAS
jgi:hypothetical protein